VEDDLGDISPPPGSPESAIAVLAGEAALALLDRLIAPELRRVSKNMAMIKIDNRFRK
jgi:hypothetical protein